VGVPPSLNPPRLGDPICDETAYVKRASSENQARAWNEVLADDPVFGPASGLRVGVSPMKVRGRYPLVWVAVLCVDDSSPM
jgi:hypothetical protein